MLIRTNVRFGSKADIPQCNRRVRFSFESGRGLDELTSPSCLGGRHITRSGLVRLAQSVETCSWSFFASFW
jgi:hypothetical protein